jgi:hypothetical protein
LDLRSLASSIGGLITWASEMSYCWMRPEDKEANLV